MPLALTVPALSSSLSSALFVALNGAFDSDAYKANPDLMLQKFCDVVAQAVAVTVTAHIVANADVLSATAITPLAPGKIG